MGNLIQTGKKLFLLAAMLLAGVCAFAQNNNNEPLKGDVNGDGKVDVADIVAIIEIMKNGGTSGETASYYYVGTTKPTSSMTIPGDGWNKIDPNSNQIRIETQAIIPDVIHYVAIPHSYGYQCYDMTGSETQPAVFDVSQITINGIEYDLFTSTETRYRLNCIFKV